MKVRIYLKGIFLLPLFLTLAVAGAAAAQTDSDGDGMPDQWENLYSCLDPLAGDSTHDPDSDTLNNLAEYGLSSDPCLSDTDQDGLSDPEEVTAGTMISFWDTDLDGLPDGFDPDPLLSQTDLDSDGDSNPDAHEYWNGTSPLTPDPVGFAECGFWAESDGDGFVTSGDYDTLLSAMIGSAADYSKVIPQTGVTQDLDSDGFPTGNDTDLLTSMMIGAEILGMPSRPAALERQSPTLGVVRTAVGDTVRLVVRVVNEAVPARRTPGIAVVFEVDPLSTPGSASLLGGEGEAGTGRYDISTGTINEGLAAIVVRIDAPGEVYINARVPECGSEPNIGRYCPPIAYVTALTVYTEGPECRDLDGDGHWVNCVDPVSHPGPDCDDADPNNWDACATCRDSDGDAYYLGCNRYLTLAGPDCSDTDRNNWTACSTCRDSDGDSSFVECDAYVTITGPDCNDADRNNWVSCETCMDFDFDTYWYGCDAYTSMPGPDCDDMNPENWASCATCVDQDMDGYYKLCDLFISVPGPDCDDLDMNNWTSCATCHDADGDNWYVSCDSYKSIYGPDCGDTDPDNWDKCSTCVDADSDGFYAGCNRYNSRLGPDRKDGDASYSSYFIITVANPGAGYTASLYTDGGSDNSSIPYPGVTARWVNPKLRLQGVTTTASGSTVSFTIHSNASVLKSRVWMFAWARNAVMTSAPRLTNNQGDHVFIIGPIPANGDKTYALSASGFNPSGYKFYIDFIQVDPRVGFSSNRLDPMETWESQVFSGDTGGGDVVQSTFDPAAVFNANPVFSPAGEWIAYPRGRYLTCQVGSTISTAIRPEMYIVHPDGSNRRRVSEGSVSTTYATWNPQGTVIAYDCKPACDAPNTNICTYNLRTGAHQTIFSGAGYYKDTVSMPRWSPDGQYLVFQTKDLSQNEAWMYAEMNPDTGEPLGPARWFTGGFSFLANEYYWKAYYLDWAWAPDSLHVAVTSQRYLCWCGNATDSKYKDCDSPSKPPTCYWAYWDNSATAFPKTGAVWGIGILNFNEVLNATTLPIGMTWNRLSPLGWTTLVSPIYTTVYPTFDETGRKLYYEALEPTNKNYIRYVKLLSDYTLNGTTQYNYTAPNTTYYNRTPNNFPPISGDFFPVMP